MKNVNASTLISTCDGRDVICPWKYLFFTEGLFFLFYLLSEDRLWMNSDDLELHVENSLIVTDCIKSWIHDKD